MAKHTAQTDRADEELRCPKCGSPRIRSGGAAVFAGGALKRPMVCDDCKATWEVAVVMDSGGFGR